MKPFTFQSYFLKCRLILLVCTVYLSNTLIAASQVKINIVSEKEADVSATYIPSSNEIGWPIRFDFKIRDQTLKSVYGGPGNLTMSFIYIKKEILGPFSYYGREINEDECNNLVDKSGGDHPSGDCSLISTYWVDNLGPNGFLTPYFSFTYQGKSYTKAIYMAGDLSLGLEGTDIDCNQIKNPQIKFKTQDTYVNNVKSLMSQLNGKKYEAPTTSKITLTNTSSDNSPQATYASGNAKNISQSSTVSDNKPVPSTSSKPDNLTKSNQTHKPLGQTNESKSVEYTNKGNEYFAKDPDVAEMYYKNALELDANNENARTNLERLRHNRKLYQQAEQIDIETAELTSEVETLTDQAYAAVVSGDTHASAMTGVKTAELMAKSGSSSSEAIIGGAGVAVGTAVLNSWMNPKVQYDVVKDFNDHTFKGKMSNGKPKEGIVIYENGDVCKGESFFGYKDRAIIVKGTCVYHNGSEFKGRFIYGAKHPGAGVLSYADGSIYNGSFKGNPGIKLYDKRWTYGTYRSPDKQFLISGTFNKDRKLTLGSYTYNYQSGSGNSLKVSYPDHEKAIITFSDGHILIINRDRNEPQKKPETIYRQKLYGGKKAKLEIANIDASIQSVTELGGRNNLAYIYAYFSRQTTDSVMKDKYYSKAMELSISENQKQCIEYENNTNVSLGGMFQKWTRYSQSLRWNFYKLEESKKDPYFNYYSAIQCLDEDNKSKAEEYINFAIANAEKDEIKANINVYIGTYYDRKKEYNTAKEYYYKGLEIYPDSKNALISLGWLYYELRDIEQSKKYSSKSLELYPNTVAGYNLALANVYEGNVDEAKLLYRKYREALDKKERESAIKDLIKLKEEGKFVDEIDDIINNILD